MFPYWQAWGKVLQGWALTDQRHHEKGIVQIQQGLTDYRITGAKLIRPYYLALLAEAYGKAEQWKNGLGVLNEALEKVNKTEEH